MTIDEAFRGFFPGSSTPLPPLDESDVIKSKPENIWDASPVTKVVHGNDIEFFTIGAVATALNKSAVTIRLWIREQHLPQASFRLPAKNGIQGRRLYTRPQIEALILVAQQHNLIDDRRIQWAKHPTFAADVHAAWKALPPL